MPFQEVGDNAGALGSIIGLVGGYLAGNPRRKREQEQQQYERGRNTQADQRAAQEVANQTLEASHRSTDWQTAQDQEKRRQAFIASLVTTIGPAPSDADVKKDPNAASNYFARRAAALAASPDTQADAAQSSNIALALARGYQAETGGQKNVASAGLDEARTKQINEWKQRAAVAYQQKLDFLKHQQNGQQVIARMNEAAAYARTQLSSGGAMARAQLSADERMTIAQMAALNAANGQDQQRAYQTAVQQHQTELKQWETDQVTGREAAKAGAKPPADFMQPAPQFNFSMPAQNAAQPIIIEVPVPQPDGTVKKVPHVIHVPPKGAAPPPGGSKSAAAPAAAPAAPQGPHDLGSIIRGLFGGGKPAASPAAPAGGQQTKINPANGKTYYLHADGNYYLTP